MENNTNEILGIDNSKPFNPNLTVHDYSLYRDSFWKNRYPVSRILYVLTMFLGWIVIVFSGFSLVAIMLGSGFLKEFIIGILLSAIFAGIVMLFISETILFQIDKNFFAYIDIHKKLEQLSNEEKV